MNIDNVAARDVLLVAARAVFEGGPVPGAHDTCEWVGGWYSCHAIKNAGDTDGDIRSGYTAVFEDDGNRKRLERGEHNRVKNGTDWWIGYTHVSANQESRTYALLLFREAYEDVL